MKSILHPRTQRFALRIFGGLLISAVFAGLIGQAAAQDKKPGNATGTWKWKTTARNGQPIEMTLRLKQEGEKLTGVQLGRGGESAIQEGRIQEGKISLKVVPEFGGGNVFFKYEGTLKGDTIEGKTERNFGGESTSSDWVAKREVPKEKQVLEVTGTWQWTLTTSAGQTFEPRVRLQQAGDKLNGVVIWGETEMPLTEGQIEDERISFNVVRERNGRTVTTKYKGKLTADSIQGKIESDWSGDVQTFDWNAKRVGGVN